MSEIENINFIFEVMNKKLDQFFDASNVLDQKISVLLGFLATIVAGLLVFLKDNLKIQIYPLFSVNYFGLGVILFFISMLFCIIPITTKKYYYPPNEENLYSEESLNSEILELKNQIIADIKKGFEENHKIHESKAFLFNCSIWISFLGLVSILIYFG